MFSVIFPGQGSQSVGMAKDLYNKFDIAKEFYVGITIIKNKIQNFEKVLWIPK